MRQRRGFTIIELVVVMVIMAILLTLAGFSINGAQANARDSQRNTDISIISRGLETRYKEGDAYANGPSGYVVAGSYPDINEMASIIGQTVTGFSPSQSGGYSNNALPGTAVEDFTPPGVGGGAYAGFTIVTCSGSSTSVCTTPANDSASTGSTWGNSVTKDKFYYEPIDANGNICRATTCVRYNLYWRTEVDNQAHILRSKHQ